MAFENINVNSLRSALNDCKRSLNYDTTKTLKNNIASSNEWQSDAKTNLNNALITLTDVRYKELESKITNYLNVVTKIENYKKLEESVKNLRRDIRSLSENLYKEEKNTIFGITYYKDVKDEKIASLMSSKSQLILENIKKMHEIEQQVADLI